MTQNNGGPGYGQFLSFQQTYTYDNVNRLSQTYENPPGNASPYWSRAFSYDRYGNMWVSASSGLGVPPSTPSASGAFNTATNRLTIGSYDAAGNQTVFSNFTAAYDGENRQTLVTDGTSGNQMTYRYDGNGQRVIKGNTVYVYDAFSQLVAQYNNYPVSSVTCTTCYLSVDHLGSTRLVTDGSANVVARHDHMPFGEELSSGVSGRTAQWDGQDGVTQKFTGQEREAETGLDFFQARYYSSAMGRFLSPDPANAGADPSNPQSWNGYSYVLNNPISLIDPSGACSQGVDGSYYDDDNTGPENGGSFLYTGDCVRQDGYARLRILREEGRLDAEKCIRMTSNQFLSSLGEPTQVEAELGRVYQRDGLDEAFRWVERTVIPMFERQEENRKRRGRARRGNNGESKLTR